MSVCYGDSSWAVALKLNFTATNASDGGTPGQQNSVYDASPDTIAPSLVEQFTLSEFGVMLKFSEFLDSTVAKNTSNYNFNTSTVVSQAFPQAPEYTDVLLFLSSSY